MGPINKEFSNYPAFQPDVIDGWKALRVVMPERTYTRYPTNRQMKFPHVKGEMDYNYDPKNHPEAYNKWLTTHTKKFKVKL